MNATSDHRALPTGVVTFLLTDVVGSTRLWERHPDRMPDALALHDEVMRAAVESNGGVLLKAKGEGDSTFSVFQRASDSAAAALAAQGELERAGWPPECRLTVRMSLHSGEAIERDRDYFGRTVNRAARLRAVAGAGEILVSLSAAELIAETVPPGAHLVPLGIEHLRDLDRPESVFVLTTAPESVEARGSASGAAPWQTGPLHPKMRSLLEQVIVGRSSEIAALAAAWREVEDTRGGLVLVEGEPGMGKSRLAAELARQVHDGGGAVLVGRCDEHGGSPHQPFVDALRAVLERVPLPDVQRVLGGRIGALARLVPDLLPVVHGRVDDEAAERERLHDGVAAVFGQLATAAPVLLILEDLHWAAPATIELLRSLLVRADLPRLLVVATARPEALVDGRLREFLGGVHQLPGSFVELRLAGLSAGDTAELLGSGEQAVADEEARRIHDLTGGNPLFALAVAGSSVDDGSTEIPRTVAALLERETRELDTDVLHYLRVAAVLGVSFEVELAAQLAGVSLFAAEDALEQAERRRLVHEHESGAVYVYEFHHALLAAALLAGLPNVRRRRLHAEAIAVVREAAVVEGDRVARMARHTEAAGATVPATTAIEAYRTAAAAARAQLASSEAAHWLELAKGRADALGDDALCLDVDTELGSVLRALDRRDGTTLLAAVVDRALDLGDATRAVRALAGADPESFTTYLGVERRRVEQIERALALLTPAQTAERAAALSMLAAEITFDDPDGRRFVISDESLALARSAGQQALVSSVLRHRSALLESTVFVERRRSETDELLADLARRDAPPHERFALLARRAQIHEQLGEVDEGEALVAEMQDIVDRGEILPRQQVYFEMHRAGWAVLFGDLPGAMSRIRAAFTLVRALDLHSLGMATGRIKLAVSFWQDRVDDMLPGIAAGASVIPTLVAHHAYWLLQAGRHDECASVWDRWDDSGVEQLFTTGGTGESTVMEAASVCATFGTPDRCRRYYELLLPCADTLINPYAPDQPTHLYLGQLALAIGDADLAVGHTRSAIAFAERVRAPLMAGRAQLELARMLLGLGGNRDEIVQLATAASDVGAHHGAAWLIRHAGAFLDDLYR